MTYVDCLYVFEGLLGPLHNLGGITRMEWQANVPGSAHFPNKQMGHNTAILF